MTSKYHSYLSVMEIRINLHLVRENLIAQHTQRLQHPTWGHNSWQQSKSWVGSYFTLVHIFHVIPFRAIRGWPIQYPSMHHCRCGRVSSNSVTVETTKFAGPQLIMYVSAHNRTCSSGPSDRSLTDSGGGYHFGAPKMKTIYSHPSHPEFSTSP
jgi:hypothetical protein